jgi:MFS family permease
LLTVTVPFYVSAGIFMAGCNTWAAQQNIANAGSSLGILLLLLCTGAVFGVVFQGLAGLNRLDERTQVIVCLFAAAILVAICSVSLLLSIPVGLLYSVVAVAGVFVGLLYVRTISLLQRHGPRNHLGRIFGVNEVVSALCFVLSVGFVGLFLTHLGAGIIWAGSACVLFLGGLAALLFFKND